MAPTELPLAGAPVERSDAARNRERILCAAREVLACEGADGLSMNAVAAAAGVGKGTVFRRFGDREGLTRALLDHHTAALQDAFLSGPPPLGPGAPPAQRLEAFLHALALFEADNLELLLAADAHIEGPHPVEGTFLLHVRTLIAELDPALDAPVLARLLLGALTPRTLQRLVRGEGAAAEQVADGVVALVRGLTGGG